MQDNLSGKQNQCYEFVYFSGTGSRKTFAERQSLRNTGLNQICKRFYSLCLPQGILLIRDRKSLWPVTFYSSYVNN
jgi:hypothetical protein